MTEVGLLQHGDAGRLQFSMWVVPPEEHYSLKVECHCYSKEDDELILVNSNELLSKKPKLFKVENSTITRILSNTRPQYEHPETQSNYSTLAELLPDCTNCAKDPEDCPFRKSPESCRVLVKIPEPRYMNEDGDEVDNVSNITELLKIRACDLVVTLEEVRRFEQEELKNASLHPCAIKGTEGYSEDLTIALEIWEAVFIRKETFGVTSGKQAGTEYIKQNYPEKYKNSVKRNEYIATIALSQFSDSNTGTQLWETYVEKCKSLTKDS